MNFSFINPLLLWGLLLAAVPIIIHLISVKKAKPLKFPEMRFLKLAVTRTMKKIKLLQFLLLLLRILAVTLLALAFARLLIQDQSAGGKDEPLSACLLLDNSYSMEAMENGRTSFDRAKEACLASLKAFRPEDRVAFACFSSGVTDELRFSGDFKKVSTAISVAKISFLPTSMQSAMNFGFSALKESASKNKQIIIFTDMAKHGMNFTGEAGTAGYDKNAKLIFVDTGRESANSALSGVEISRSSSEQVRLRILADNFSQNKLVKAPLSAFIGGVRKAFGFIDIEPERQVKKDLYSSGAVKGSAGYAELDAADAVKSDNKYYFSFEAEEKVKVLCVDGDPKLSQYLSETFFLKTALLPGERSDSYAVPTLCVTAELEKKDLSGFTVIFICNAAEISSAVEGKLISYVKNGGNLVYFLGDRVDVLNYGALDPDVFPVKLLKTEAGENRLNPLSVNKTLGLFRELDEFALQRVTYYKYFSAIPMAGTVSLINFSDGLSFLMEKAPEKKGEGRVMVFTGPVDRDWGDLPLKPVFPPFIQGLVKYLSGIYDRGEIRSISAGTSYTSDFAGVRIVSAGAVKPDGAPAKAAVSGSRVTVPDTALPGVYVLKCVLQDGNSRISRFAVNLDIKSGESSLKKAKLYEPRGCFKSSRVYGLMDTGNVSSELLLIMRGRELNGWLLLAALCLLALEGYISLRKI